ncbi:MAG: SspB family protein [Pseudomonadota bacterium]
MADDHIRYDVLVQDALRGVVRKVMREIVRTGLPGDHHFYIAFDTKAPGVRISSRLREQYPDEMTVVLQHQFWDLAVTEHTFEVGLSFGGIPERLLIPFSAIKGFFDPSVQFGLQFEVDAEGRAANDADGTQGNENEATMPTAGNDERGGAVANEPDDKAAKTDVAPLPAAESDASEDGNEDKDTGTADVVSLDSFRKKT